MVHISDAGLFENFDFKFAAGEEFDDSLTKAKASRKIDELQQKTGRGAE